MDNEQFYMIPLENYFGTESDLKAFVKAWEDVVGDG